MRRTNEGARGRPTNPLTTETASPRPGHRRLAFHGTDVLALVAIVVTALIVAVPALALVAMGVLLGWCSR
jgi:hypothetical protein